MTDLACSLVLLAAVTTVAAVYEVRRTRSGPVRFERVEQAGASFLLGKGAMEMAYFSLEPVVRACVHAGISANTLTFLSLALGALSGAALAFGHFGVAAVLSAFAFLGDALDGAVARLSGEASRTGEVLDAAVDRYEEFFFLGGLTLFYRENPLGQVLALLALAGSFMVSYGTAKAEAASVTPPRGSLRRAERAAYLCAGALLTPIAAAVAERLGLRAWVGEVPMLAVLTLIGIFANVSAVRRLAWIARALRARDALAKPAGPGVVEPTPHRAPGGPARSPVQWRP